MVYRHSLNKNKNTKTAALAPRPKADQVAKKSSWLATTLGDGSLVEIHQNSVFNDPVIVNRLCLDGALGTEGHVVDQDTHEGSHHLSRHPWAVPRTPVVDVDREERLNGIYIFIVSLGLAQGTVGLLIEEFDLICSRAGLFVRKTPGHLVLANILASSHRELPSIDISIQSHTLCSVGTGQAEFNDEDRLRGDDGVGGGVGRWGDGWVCAGLGAGDRQ